MAMSTSQADGEVLVDINTTPLIDVMLVLLTLLILTLPIQTHAVKLDMPRPNTPPPTADPVVLDMGITSFSPGTCNSYIFNDTAITTNCTHAPDDTPAL